MTGNQFILTFMAAFMAVCSVLCFAFLPASPFNALPFVIGVGFLFVAVKEGRE